MAVYKVPQNVEADDKLIGPFSFKQFIFLMICALGVGLGYGLYVILPPLAIIPLPVVLFFAVLALPLRQDQPMEVYLAAIISFLTRPKVRLWRPDGIESLIEIVAPRDLDTTQSKSYSQEEVRKRLSYLADISDSQGWSVRGANTAPNSILREELYNEAQTANDLLDEMGNRSQSINNLLEKRDNQRRQEIMDKMQQPQQSYPSIVPAATTTISYDIPDYTPSDPYQKLVSPLYTPMKTIQPTDPDEDIRLVVNPYPAINQSVISPLGEQSSTPETNYDSSVTDDSYNQPPANPTEAKAAPQDNNPAPAPSVEPISPAIIDLANNHKHLSVETLGREAQRIKKKELMLKENEEILISLR